jgi:hypothetical protein
VVSSQYAGRVRSIAALVALLAVGCSCSASSGVDVATGLDAGADGRTDLDARDAVVVDIGPDVYGPDATAQSCDQAFAALRAEGGGQIACWTDCFTDVTCSGFVDCWSCPYRITCPQGLIHVYVSGIACDGGTADGM